SIWLSSQHAEPGDPQAWILDIVMKKSFTLALSRKRRAKREERSAMGTNREATAAAQVEKEEVLTTLRNHIDQLPELERQLIVFSYGASMSHQKIAELVGMPRTT